MAKATDSVSKKIKYQRHRNYLRAVAFNYAENAILHEIEQLEDLLEEPNEGDYTDSELGIIINHLEAHHRELKT